MESSSKWDIFNGLYGWEQNLLIGGLVLLALLAFGGTYLWMLRKMR